MAEANATFLTFKPSGKYYASGRGVLPRSVFEPYYKAKDPREEILGANGGKMPGLNSTGRDKIVVVTPDDSVDFGFPIHLAPLEE